jgi:protein-L-isoaspartate(D-aspartate) O-methyltransferase
VNAHTRGIGMTSQRTRERLIQRLREEGIRDERVLGAILNVPRHVFVDEALASRAYEDTALPIGFGQTISQPFIVAIMTQTLLAGGTPKKVLEIGTGSGYQTAVLAGLVPEVYSVERLATLFQLGHKRMRQLNCRNVRLHLGDGTQGWPEHAPYDGIIVTAAPTEVPPALLEQLALGGRMVIPVGGPGTQELQLVQRNEKGYTHERLEFVSFVPLVRGQQ